MNKLMNDQLHSKKNKKTKTKNTVRQAPFHNKLILLGMQPLKWFFEMMCETTLSW